MSKLIYVRYKKFVGICRKGYVTLKEKLVVLNANVYCH